VNADCSIRQCAMISSALPGPPMSTIVPSEFSAVTSPLWLDQSETSVHRGARDWLFEEGSLTQRLTLLSSGSFSIKVLREGWEPLREDECEALQLTPHTEGWVREVALCGGDVPWVFARTVAARETLEPSGFNLAGLGNRSLGDLLFEDTAFVRQPIEVCQYPTEWLPEGQRIEGLWARRSRFDRANVSVLVAEVFLPAFWYALMSAPVTR
jgi:chorismate--pyruvate lyase